MEGRIEVYFVYDSKDTLVAICGDTKDAHVQGNRCALLNGDYAEVVQVLCSAEEASLSRCRIYPDGKAEHLWRKDVGV